MSAGVGVGVGVGVGGGAVCVRVCILYIFFCVYFVTRSVACVKTHLFYFLASSPTDVNGHVFFLNDCR